MIYHHIIITSLESEDLYISMQL